MNRSARSWLVVAGLAALLALAVPLGTTSAQVGLGVTMPGFCTTSYDLDGWATMNCTPGVLGTTVEVVGVRGLQLPVRIYAALAFAAAVVALRARSQNRHGLHPAAPAAVASAVLGVAVGGLSGTALLLAVVAAIGLAIALFGGDQASTRRNTTWAAPAPAVNSPT